MIRTSLWKQVALSLLVSGCFSARRIASPTSTSTRTSGVAGSSGRSARVTTAAATTSTAVTNGTSSAGATGSTGVGVTTVSPQASATTGVTSVSTSATATVGGTSTGTGPAGPVAGSTGGSLAATTAAGSTAGTTARATSTAAANTATAGSTGSTGTPQADCRTQGCDPGESCVLYASGGPAYYLCSCAPEDYGTNPPSPDTCAKNRDGQTVCDPNNLRCRFPMDYDPCNGNTKVSACATGYDCFTYPAGGGQNASYCLQKCTNSSQCTQLNESCQKTSITASYCAYDNCGPGLGYDAGQIYGPCEIDQPGDGFCQPYTYDGGVYGQCFLVGTQGPGEYCSGYQSKTLACAENELCFGSDQLFPDGGASATCSPTCNAVADAGKESSACPPGWTCYSYGDGRVGNVDPGYCYP